MASLKLPDIFGHDALRDRLRHERGVYGIPKESRISNEFADSLSRNFRGDFIGDQVSISDRADFKELGDHYDPTINLVRSNLKKSAPSVIAHELGHAFTMGREARGHAGLSSKLKYFARLLSGTLGQAAITAGSADLVLAARNKSSYLRGSILTGAGLATSIASAISRYNDEARATSEGLLALKKTLSDPGGIVVHEGGKKIRLTGNRLREAMEAGEANLEAALRTYKKALPINTLISSGISGALGAALGSYTPSTESNKVVALAAGTGIAPSLGMAILLESSMRSKAGDQARRSIYDATGDKAVNVLASRRN